VPATGSTHRRLAVARAAQRELRTPGIAKGYLEPMAEKDTRRKFDRCSQMRATAQTNAFYHETLEIHEIMGTTIERGDGQDGREAPEVTVYLAFGLSTRIGYRFLADR
jgi:hypothetical protein